MTPQIKQRIEKIKNGQVPEGYKKTDIGIIPVDWNQTKLGLIASHVLEKNIHSDFKTTFTNSATKGVIKQTDFFDKNISNDENISGYYIVQENDYIYNPRISVSAPCGPINQSHFSEKGIVSPLYIVFKMNGDMGKSKYIESFFCSSLWHRYICEIANYGARHDRMNITNKDFFNMPILLPPSDEQKKIAEILAMQDKIIELKEHKIEELKKLKVYYLSKMFPKKGSNYPEVRFPGFTAPWKQRKAKKLFVATADKGHPELPVLSATQDRGMIRRDENSINIYHDKKNEAGYKRVLVGQFVIHLRSFQGGFAHSAIEGITSPAYTVFGFSEPDNHNSEYWKYVFTSKTFIRRLETVTYGIRDGRSISYDEFLAMDFTYPSKEEQTVIANCLDTLDHLITLHQRELDEEKKLKKSLMQLLLSGIVRV